MHPLGKDCFADGAREDAEKIDNLLLSVTQGGRPLCNLQFADDIDLRGVGEEDLRKLTERPEKTTAGYDMEIRSNKGKILVNSIKPRPSTNMWMNEKTLEEVDQFKYLGSTQLRDGTSIREDQTVTNTFSHDKTSNTVEKQRFRFSDKD